MTANDIPPSLQLFLEDEESVNLAYLFGSVAKGKAGPLSDIDIAVLFSRKADRETAYAALYDRLVLTLKTDRLDLIDLSRAPYPLRYRVIREGLLILCRDNRIKEHFESDTVLRYLDFKPLRDRALALASRGTA